MQHEREAAAAKPAGRAPSVLLPSRLQLIDRAQEVDRAIARVHAGDRLLAFEGDPGVGKSTVAIELAHKLHLGGHDALGQCDFVWIDFCQRAPSLSEICQQLTLLTGDQSLSTAADESKLNVLRAYLARRATVLVLDNVRMTQGQTIQPLREFLRKVPSGSLVIASVNSSHAFPPATRLPLQGLSSPDLRKLIEYWGDQFGVPSRGTLDGPLLERLEVVVDGDLRLIERFLQAVATGARSTEALVAALEHGEGLDELFMPIWDGLSANAKRALAGCAYLTRGAIIDQLRVACELDDGALVAALGELVEARLVSVVRASGRPDTYSCSPTLQRFVIAKTSPERIDAITVRLLDFYVNQFASESENARWASSHIAGIRAVVQWLFDRGEDRGLQVLFASVLDILFTLGLFDDRILFGQLSYESAMRSGNDRAASLASDVLSSTFAARGEEREAREALALGLLAAERSGDAGERARQMRAQGLVLYKAGKATEALAVMEGAEDLAKEAGELEVLANTYSVRTVAHWYLGNLDESVAAAEEDIRVCQEMGWQRALAYPFRNLAEVAIHRGQFGEARALIQHASGIAVAHGDRRQIARVHLTAARLALFSGDTRGAGEAAAAAREAALSLGLSPELREAGAIRRAAIRARRFPVLRIRYARLRPLRFTDAPVGN